MGPNRLSHEPPHAPSSDAAEEAEEAERRDESEGARDRKGEEEGEREETEEATEAAGEVDERTEEVDESTKTLRRSFSKLHDAAEARIARLQLQSVRSLLLHWPLQRHRSVHTLSHPRLSPPTV